MYGRKIMRDIKHPFCCKAAFGFAGTIGLICGLGAIATPIDAMAAVTNKLKRECRTDYKSFCPAYKVGTSKMRSCMRSNGRQLSWGCYRALKDHGYVKRR